MKYEDVIDITEGIEDLGKRDMRVRNNTITPSNSNDNNTTTNNNTNTDNNNIST